MLRRVRRSNAPAAPWVHRYSRSPIPASGAPSPVRATAEAVDGGTLVRLDRSPAADEQIQTLSGSSHGLRNEVYIRLKWLSDILRCCCAFRNEAVIPRHCQQTMELRLLVPTGCATSFISSVT